MSTRVCLSFDDSPSGFSSKNVWLLFDKSACRIVADLEYLIRKKFDINALCNLYMNSFLLPSQEKIDLVRDGDNLRIQKLSSSARNESRPPNKNCVAEDSDDDQPVVKKKKLYHKKSETLDSSPSKHHRKGEKQKLKNKKLTKLSNDGSVKANGSAHEQSTKDLSKKQDDSISKKKHNKNTMLSSRAKMSTGVQQCRKETNKLQKSLPKTSASKMSSRTSKQTKKSTKAKKTSSSSSLSWSSSTSAESDHDINISTARKVGNKIPIVSKRPSSKSKAKENSSFSRFSSRSSSVSGRQTKKQMNTTYVASQSLSKDKPSSNVSLSCSSSSTSSEESSSSSSSEESSNEQVPALKSQTKKQAGATKVQSLSNMKKVSPSSSSSTKISCSTETCSTAIKQREELPNSTMPSPVIMTVSLQQLTSKEPNNTRSGVCVAGTLRQEGNGNHIHFDSDEDESSVNHQLTASLNLNNNSSCDTAIYTNTDGLAHTISSIPLHVNNVASTVINSHQKDHSEQFNVGTVQLATNHEQPQKKHAVDFTTSTPLLGPPRAGDRITYKVLEISASYTPEMSDCKEGVVLEYDPTSYEVLVELTEDSLAKPRGDGNVSTKFELISGDEDEDEDDPAKPPPVLERKVAVFWSSMVEPRLIGSA